ncbi:gp53-like domain-containing protein [Citrobacter freundii]
MFHLDNNSGVSAMPPVGTVQSSAPRWFTEGGGGTPASYPGADWYNIIQAELLNFLSAYGIAPDKADLSQLQKAIEAAIKDKATAKSPLLTAIAALVTSADKMPYFNGKDTVAMTALTAFAREVLAQTDAAGVLSKLGFTQVGRDIIAGGTASDVLAYLGVPNLLNGKQDADNTLTALARLAGAANKLPYFSGPDVMSMTDFSDIGRAIIAASTKSSVLSYLELTTLGQALVKGGTASDILRTLGFNNGNGWYRIGEILIQFGHIPFAATSVPVTFPIPFPVVIDQIIVSDAGYASGNTWGATDRTQLGFTAQTNSTGQGGQYFAIGR